MDVIFKRADIDKDGTGDRMPALESLVTRRAARDPLWFSRLSCVRAEVIDFEEFIKETPKTLRTSLVKLAKSNGHDLGFLP